jgi:Ser/Thr protein kinase RdoA (MazF antagonist)
MHDWDEDELAGGNASASVVRVGKTVRKPWLPTTDRTIAYMRMLRAKGIDVPEHLGRDDQGRQVLEYVPGQLAMDLDPLDLVTVTAVGRLVRSIHDASAGMPAPTDWPVLLPADEPDLLCHNDLATWNLIIDGDRLVFIDWDGAGPSNRLWDLAYAAISFGHLFPGSGVAECTARLRALLDGYAAEEAVRAILPATLARRARAMHDMLLRSHQLGEQPWAGMYAEGHGGHWRAATRFIDVHQRDWVRACNQP